MPVFWVQPKTLPLGEFFRKEPVNGSAPVGPEAVVRILKIDQSSELKIGLGMMVNADFALNG